MTQDERNEASLLRQRARREYNRVLESIDNYYGSQEAILEDAINRASSTKTKRAQKAELERIQRERQEAEDRYKAQFEELHQSNDGIDGTNTVGKNQDAPSTVGGGGQSKILPMIPPEYIATSVTLCQNGSPVTGEILFNAD